MKETKVYALQHSEIQCVTTSVRCIRVQLKYEFKLRAWAKFKRYHYHKHRDVAAQDSVGKPKQ